MKIGILGGTFDPIHRGHLALARHALKQFKLDQIFFIPAARPPHKKNVRCVTSSKHRLAMVRCAVGRSACFKGSELEIKRKGPSYTFDTVLALRRRYPNARFFLILGQDAYQGLKGWKDSSALKQLVHFLVARRPGSRKGRKKESGVSRVRMPLDPISSSEIRRIIKDGCEPKDFLPRAVLHYIRFHHLYGCPA